MDYDSLTDQINNTLSSGISKGTSWEAVPGGLDKVSASAMGFAWGMGGGRVWVCQLPCAGNWKQVDVPVTSSLRDIVTDDTHIYVLFQDNLAMNPFLKKSASGNFFEQGHIYPPAVLANRERRASLTNF